MLTLPACRKATISASLILGLPPTPNAYPVSISDSFSNGQVTLSCPASHKEKSARMIVNRVLTPPREPQKESLSLPAFSLGGLSLDVTPSTVAAILFLVQGWSHLQQRECWRMGETWVSSVINQPWEPQNSRLLFSEITACPVAEYQIRSWFCFYGNKTYKAQVLEGKHKTRNGNFLHITEILNK